MRPLGRLGALAPAAATFFTFAGEVESTNLVDNTDANDIGDLDCTAISGGSGASTVFSDAISNLNILVDTFSYTRTDSGIATIYDNHLRQPHAGSAASVTDAFFACSGPLWGPKQGGLAATDTHFSIGTIVDLVILSDRSAPGLMQFEDLIAANTFDGNTNILGFETGEDLRFSLASVTVTTAAVSVPAAVLLMVTALAGAGALRRRCKAG